MQVFKQNLEQIKSTIHTVVIIVFISTMMVSCYGPIETTKYVPLSQQPAAPDSGIVSVGDVQNQDIIFEKYPSGQFKSKKVIDYKSKRKTRIEEHVYHKVDILIMFTGLPKEDPEPFDSSILVEDSLGNLVDTTTKKEEPMVKLEGQSFTVDTLTGDTTFEEPKDPILSLFTDTVVESEIFDKIFRTDEHIYTQRRKMERFYDGGEVLKQKTKKRSKFRDGCEILVMERTKMYNEDEKLIYKENFCWLMWRQVRYIYDEDGKRLQKRVLKCMFKPKFRNYP